MCGLLPSTALAKDPASASSDQSDPPSLSGLEPSSGMEAKDDFDLSVRGSTNIQMFRRALLPGPGGAIVTDKTYLPLHQSLSLRASRVDTPLGQDSLDVEVATWGQLVFGSPTDQRAATWDISSAFLRQHWGPLSLAVGRQPVVGGAARYSRLDGAMLRADLTHNLSVSGYGGWTVLPRYNQWYGYHHLGDSFEDWTGLPAPSPKRGQNWMSGFVAQWQDDRAGSLGLSYHYQAENNSLTNEILGINGSLTYFDRVKVRADALLSTEQARFSDVRANIVWDAVNKDSFDLTLRGEALHTVPALLLSQASVFSIFSYEEVTEVGGGIDARLLSRLTVEASGFAQTYQEGTPGMRLGLGASFKSDPDGTFLVRAMSRRVTTIDNGYWMIRGAATYAFLPDWYGTVDMYQYLYDEEIRGFGASSFYAAHVGYRPRRNYDARIGGSLNSSPYARLDAQLLARLTISWDRSSSL